MVTYVNNVHLCKMENVASDVSLLNESIESPIQVNWLDFFDEDPIHLPPSSELIPDEYDHQENNKGLVLIFYSISDEDNKEVLVKKLSDQGYDVSNVFQLTTKDDILQQLLEVAQKNDKDKTCLMVFLLGTIVKEDKFLLDDDEDNYILIKDVWSNFTGDKCLWLKNKPKVFVFQGTKKIPTTTSDAGGFKTAPKNAYDVPSEADLLIIYKRVENIFNRQVFIQELCNSIDQFGKRDDMISLVTRTTQEEIRPIVISTLTRKFFLSFSQHREHYYDMHVNHESTVNHLKSLREAVLENGSSNGDKKILVTQTDSVSERLSKPKQSVPKAKQQKPSTRPPWRH